MALKEARKEGRGKEARWTKGPNAGACQVTRKGHQELKPKLPVKEERTS